MNGTQQRVSTLLTTVGLRKAPSTAGNGGLIRGHPRLPSRLSIRPVSSPQMYAPAPRWTWISRSKPEPRISLPSRPASRASAMARSMILVASMYSKRM